MNLKRIAQTIYPIIFISILFFCTISPNDTWLWYTSSIIYFWSTIAFFFGINIFFSNKKSFFDFVILGVSAIYIGGSNEPLTFFIILSLLFLISKKKELAVSSIGIILICSSFLINYLSSGTEHRDEITPNLAIIDLVLYTGYSSVKFLFFTIYKTFIPALLLSVPFYLLGKKTTQIHLIKNFNAVKELYLSAIAILLTVVTNQLLVVYVLGGLSPDRAGIASSIVIAIILVRYVFLLGNSHQEKYSVLKNLIVVNIISLVVFNIYYFKVHLLYAKKVDERVEFIKEVDSKTIFVKPLPNSGYIYSAEITTDADNFKNQHLRNGLGIKNDIVLTNDQ
jgi:hypothetical protein